MNLRKPGGRDSEAIPKEEKEEVSTKGKEKECG